jgi:hypothetical protein
MPTDFVGVVKRMQSTINETPQYYVGQAGPEDISFNAG